MTERLYVIWSLEHEAWWAPGRMGYVLVLDRAGRYAEAEAAAILERANYPPGTFHECAIPVDAFAADPSLARLLAGWSRLTPFDRTLVLTAFDSCLG